MLTAAARSGGADGPEARDRRRRRLFHELALRAALAVLILAFHPVARVALPPDGSRIVLASAVAALLVNALYYAAAGTGWRLRIQAHARMLADVGLITLGLYGAGGLAAAPHLFVYALVPLYAGLVLSSRACLLAAGSAIVSFLAMALGQQAGWLPFTRALPDNAWITAAFNLMLVGVVGVLTAMLSEAYRRSRLRLAEAHRELERAHDESLRMNAELQRAAQLRALGEVVAGVAHEMSNALTVATGHLGLARSRADEAPELKAHLDKVGTSLDAALRIASGTLHTARRPAAQPTAVDVADVARRVVELKAYDLRRAGVRASLDFPADLPPVRAIAFQLQQVLLNLVTNAQQAMAATPGPRGIAIRGRRTATGVVVEVADTGPGLAPEVRARLFEPFVTTKADGTGLGLAISAGIVRDLGGELDVADRPGGAVFTIRLPADAGAAAGPREPPGGCA
jgi:signal transduction histidine kinase